MRLDICQYKDDWVTRLGRYCQTRKTKQWEELIATQKIDVASFKLIYQIKNLLRSASLLHKKLSVPPAETAKLGWQVLRCKKKILSLQPELTSLARHCGLPSMMDSLEYFLGLPYLDLRFPHRRLDNIPYLSNFLSKAMTKIPRLLVNRGSQGIEAAALLFEHHYFGVSTGIYMPINSEVYRTLVAPREQLAVAAREVGEFLLQHGGSMVLVSYLEEASHLPSGSNMELIDPTSFKFWDTEHLVATNLRDSSCRLPLAETFDQTLSTMGQHTRRNLRAFQRRVVKEFAASYESPANVSGADFLELNSRSKYSVSKWIARWRYQSGQNVSGGTISGLKTGDGTWLSLIGSHSLADTVWIDWQMNREVSSSISIVSAMRAFFISSQIDLGMRWVHLEGGTPHSMKSIFIKEEARDLLFARKILSPRLINLIAATISTTGPLAKFLSSESLIWGR